MPLLTFVMILVAVGVLLWAVNKLPIVDAQMKKIINWVVLIAVVLWVLDLFGVFGPLSHIRIGR